MPLRLVKKSFAAAITSAPERVVSVSCSVLACCEFLGAVMRVIYRRLRVRYKPLRTVLRDGQTRRSAWCRSAGIGPGSAHRDRAFAPRLTVPSEKAEFHTH